VNPAGPFPRSVLVVGAGGREHALVRALAASPSHPRLLCAPGNAGIAAEAACFAVKVDDVPGLVALALREKVDFVVVGPEVPLVLGLADRLMETGVKVYGACAAGARLEASKTYTKHILLKYGIPTATAGLFSETAPALDYIRSRTIPIVVKADGLAAGKGVVVATTLAEAESAVREMIEEGKFGAGGRTILVEDCLVGEETSILVVVSGRDYYILPTSQDHKRVGDGDTGPNTGGMGAYSPDATITAGVLAQEIERSASSAPRSRPSPPRASRFCGTLFRRPHADALRVPRSSNSIPGFGDPETQVVLPRLTSDLLALLWAAANTASLGRWWIVSAGLLRDLRGRGREAAILALPFPRAESSPCRRDQLLPPASSILQAGTARDAAGESLVSSGGRVLGVVALATHPPHRRRPAPMLRAMHWIAFADKYYRRDIGAKQLNRS
jgi:phosphoribosylamine--glycine ligase